MLVSSFQVLEDLVVFSKLSDSMILWLQDPIHNDWPDYAHVQQWMRTRSATDSEEKAAGGVDPLTHSVPQVSSLLMALSACHQQKWVPQQKWVLGLGRWALNGLQAMHMVLFIWGAEKRAATISLPILGIWLIPQTAGLGLRINDDNCISRTRGAISVWNKGSSSECSDIFSFTVPEMSVN